LRGLTVRGRDPDDEADCGEGGVTRTWETHATSINSQRITGVAVIIPNYQLPTPKEISSKRLILGVGSWELGVGS
jgi:hypothetical protein